MRKFSAFGGLVGITAMLLGSASLSACGEDSPGLPTGGLPLDELRKQCGLECDVNALAEGNASISGLGSIDAFFAAVGNFSAQANLVADNIDAQLGRITTALEIDASATSAAEIKAAMVAKFQLDADAGISLKAEPAKCEVNANVMVEAAAKCDVEASPGSVKAECKGTCTAEASAEASCDASAEVVCKGTAPNLACEGSCTGECVLEAGATCKGTCNGTCSGTCSAENADGSCAGSCDGTCEGKCELKAGASCSGQCKGECEYTPPSGSCEAGASVQCKAEANASVECEGKCEGEVEPPEVSAECQASAKAEADLKVECTPPSITLDYQFSANASAEVKAEFEAFLVTFVDAYGKMLAELERGKVVVKAGVDLGAAAGGAVSGAIGELTGPDAEFSLKLIAGLECAGQVLPTVPDVIGDASARLEASVSAAGGLATGMAGG
jgi:hypothetical protein